MDPVVSAWTCPNCATAATTPFCPARGERPVVPFDLSMKGIAAQLTKTVAGVDGRLVRGLRALLRHPGRLILAYGEGRRKPFVGPFQLFLLANVVFFAVQSLTHTRVFSSSLDSHLHHQDWSALAQDLVARRLAAASTTLDRFAPLFDRTVGLNAKSLVIAMAVSFAPLLPLVFRRSRRPFSIHVVFALHLYAFLLLLFCLALMIALVEVAFGGAGLASAPVDNALTALILACSTVYIYMASGKSTARPAGAGSSALWRWPWRSA
ncbi:MAG: DUF3667 domain-containing protein [Caldimonas sp.]